MARTSRAKVTPRRWQREARTSSASPLPEARSRAIAETVSGIRRRRRKESGKPFVDRKQADGSNPRSRATPTWHGEPKSGQPCQQMEEAGCSHDHHFLPKTNDVSWILVDSGSAVTLCPLTHAQEVPVVRGPERVFTSVGRIHKTHLLGMKQVPHQLDDSTTAMIKWAIAPVRRLMMQGNKVVFWEGALAHREQEREEERSLVVQGNVHWLRAEVLDGKVDRKLLRSTHNGLRLLYRLYVKIFDPATPFATRIGIASAQRQPQHAHALMWCG